MEDLSRMHVCLRLTQARPPCAVRAPSKHVSVAAIPSTPPVRCEGTEQARKRCAATHWVDAGAHVCVSNMMRVHVAPCDVVDARGAAWLVGARTHKERSYEKPPAN